MTSQIEVRRVALMVSTSVWTWADDAGLEEIVDGHVLLALSAIPDPLGASEISAQSRLPLDTVYPALHRLIDRGLSYEEHRRHALTAHGVALVAEFDTRYSPALPVALASA